MLSFSLATSQLSFAAWARPAEALRKVELQAPASEGWALLIQCSQNPISLPLRSSQGRNYGSSPAISMQVVTLGSVSGPRTIVGPAPAPPALTSTPGGGSVLRVGHKRFYFDLGSNQRGTFLRITEVSCPSSACFHACLRRRTHSIPCQEASQRQAASPTRPAWQGHRIAALLGDCIWAALSYSSLMCCCVLMKDEGQFLEVLRAAPSSLTGCLQNFAHANMHLLMRCHLKLLRQPMRWSSPSTKSR